MRVTYDVLWLYAPASFPIHPSLCSLKRIFNHKLTYAFEMEHIQFHWKDDSVGKSNHWLLLQRPGFDSQHQCGSLWLSVILVPEALMIYSGTYRHQAYMWEDIYTDMTPIHNRERGEKKRNFKVYQSTKLIFVSSHLEYDLAGHFLKSSEHFNS